MRAIAAGALLALALAAPAFGQTSPPAGADPRTGLDSDAPTWTTLVAPPFAHTLGISRARPVHVRLFLGDRTRFDDPQGVAAVKFAADDDPARGGDDFQLTLFGVNAGRGEIIYNSSMQTLAVYGREGGGEGAFRAPRGIEATTDGRVYVADAGNARVARLRFDARDRGLEWVGAWPVGSPWDVAADARGTLFVTDRATDAVLAFHDRAADSAAARAIEGDRWPLPADVRAPLGLAVADSLDPWIRPNAYRLYLVDQDGARLRAYDAAGAVLAEIDPAALARPGAPPGAFTWVELDYFGNVWVTDAGQSALHKLDPDLAHLTTFAGPGPAEDALEAPRGVAIWRRFGQVFVAEREGARYFFVGADFSVATPVALAHADGQWLLELHLTEAADVTVSLLNAAGDTLAVATPGRYGAGEQWVAWSGWSAPPAGDLAAARSIAIEARPTYSSRKKFSRIRVLPLAAD